MTRTAPHFSVLNDACGTQGSRCWATEEVNPTACVAFRSVRDDAGRTVDFEWTFANEAATGVFGLASNRLLGQRLLAVAPEHAENRLFDWYRSIAETGERQSREIRWTRDATERWYELRAVKFGDGVAVWLDDVTERKRAEQLVMQHDRRVAEILESTSDAFFALDAQWHFVYVNHEAERLLQRQRETLLGRPVWSEFPEAVGTVFEQSYTRVARDRVQVRFETYFPPLDTWFDVTAFPSGSDGVSVFFHDISDRKRAEAERVRLLENERAARERAESSEQQLRLLVETIPQFVWTADAAGNRLSFNQRWCDYTGLSLEQSVGRGWIGAIHPDDIPVCAGRWVHSMATGATFESEHRIRSADGRYQWFLCRGLPVRDAQGGITRWIGTCTDIDEAKQATVALHRAKEQADAAVRELEAFSYSVSHDLRAPLRSISGFSQALQEDYGHLLNAEGQQYLSFMRSESVRMAQLIDELLSLSRINRASLERRPVDLSTLAARVVEELRRGAPDRPVEFVSAGPLLAQADPVLMHSVLDNLLRNAWKFTGRREHARIEWGAREQDGQPVYFVRDNGAGFDMAYADKLFGAFQRLHGVDEFEGTGIGLAIVQRIVHRHGGRVWAEGVVDGGATVFFTLPEQAS